MSSDDRHDRPSLQLPHQQLHHRDSRITRFLRKRQIAATAGGSHALAQSMLLPSRPAPAAASASDLDDQADVSAPGKNMPFNMNQSLFHVISAATSSVRMASRFDETDEDDDDDDDDDDDGDDHHHQHYQHHHHPDDNKGKSKASSWISPSRSYSIEESGRRGGARLNLASSGHDSFDDNDDIDHSLLAQSSPKLGPAPFMSQILQAQAQIDPAGFGDVGQENDSEMHPFGSGEERFRKGEKSSELAKKLMEIFSLPKLEDVVSGEFVVGRASGPLTKLY